MEIFGFDVLQLFTISNLLAILLGTFVGLLFGALPGLGVMIAIVILLPITYMMSPLASILMLLSAYQSAEYGGSISSIILGIPGTPMAAATVLDGNPLAKSHSPGKAISYSLTASTIGGLIGALVLIFLSVPISSFALKLSDPEIFLLGVLGLMGVVALGSKDVLKSLISIVLGLLVGTVGMDLITGETRFTAGYLELMEGVEIIALAVGLFALPEIFSIVSEKLKVNYDKDSSKLKFGLSLSEFKKIIKPTAIGSFIGSFVGTLPGMGSGASSWFAYSLNKKSSKEQHTFGKGNPQGIAAPESANNGTVGGSLLPLLTLGIPGSPATAIIMGAFIIHGIQPGPQVFANNTNLVYGIFFGFILSTVFMFLAARILTPIFARVVTVPNPLLVPTILFISIVGVYAANRLLFDIWLALVIGIVFFFLRKLDYSIPSFLLAFILAPIIEVGLRRALLVSDGSFLIFLTRPYSIFILILILIIISIPIFNWIKRNTKSDRWITL